MHPWSAAPVAGQLKGGEGCGTRLKENRWRGAADVEVCWARGQLGGAGTQHGQDQVGAGTMHLRRRAVPWDQREKELQVLW